MSVPARGAGTAAAPATGASPGRVLWAIPGLYFLYVAGEFLALTHIALTLTARGESAFSVGVMASSMWVGILLASLRAHPAVERLGHARILVGASAVALVAIGTMTLHETYAGWLAASFALGLAGGLVWVAGESWLAEAAPAHRRGFYVGLFETSVGLGMVAGPALLPLALAAGVSPLAVAVALLAAGLGCCAALRGCVPPSAHPSAEGGGAAGERPLPWRQVVRPLALLAVISGLLEAGSSALLPSVSARVGFSLADAAWLGAVIGAGSALLQAPAGGLADRVGGTRAMRGAWALLLVTTATLWLAADRPQQVLWGVGFVLGGVGGAVYTLVVVELGHRLSGSGLVRAMSALVTAYTAGTAAGPVVGGALFDAGGLPLLAAGLTAASALGLALALRPVTADRR